MSIGAISASFASSIAFSALPPTPMPSKPGGHQPAPMPGTVSTTQSTIESDGSSIANLALFSEPPPFAAMRTSTVFPGTMSKCTTAGVLSRVLTRVDAGSRTIDARSVLSGSRYARRTPASTMSATLIVAPAKRASMPTRTNATTMPVSWQIGR